MTLCQLCNRNEGTITHQIWNRRTTGRESLMICQFCFGVVNPNKSDVGKPNKVDEGKKK